MPVTKQQWESVASGPYRIEQRNNTVRVQKESHCVDSSVTESRLSLCSKCEFFVGGYDKSQYRCNKKTGCTRLNISSKKAFCPIGVWE